MEDNGDLMVCKICGSHSELVHKAKILVKYSVKYYQCPKCYFLQTENPFWLKEAYQESINVSDTGYVSRNIHLSRITSVLIYFFFNRKARFIDYGGGYGLFVRLMRDIGFDFYWHDAYTQNLFARGSEAENGRYELLTSFETFEHFDQPNQEISSMLEYSDNILFSTELYGSGVPLVNDWHYYGLNHGQHISFYSIRTLRFIARKYSLTLWSNGKSLHILMKRKVNPFLISSVLCVERFGLSAFVKKIMNSRTLSDWEMLRNIG